MPSPTLGLIALIPFLVALVVGLPRRPSHQAILAGAAPMLAGGLLLAFAPEVFAGRVPTVRWSWVPALGLDLTFRLDGLALLFGGLVLGIGLLIVVYAHYYFGGHGPTGRFYALLLAFVGAMTGIVLSGGLLLIVVFWELTSLTSFFLIGYWHHSPAARRGARMSLVVTGLGGLALLGGVLLLGRIVGSYDLATVLEAGPRVREHPHYLPMLALVLLGAFTKSAQVPFHFWLPRAMVAPTPVSAYLHSAAMVKAGVFLLARLHPTLAGSEAWFLLVSGVGVATLLVGAYGALWQADLKGLLAYSTISHLGLIVLLLGFGTPLASVAAVFHTVNHAIFKASLFMAAGIIDHETGTRDMRVLNGLWRFMPYTGALAIVGAGAMAGVPLLNGFLSKEMFFSEALALGRFGQWSWLVPVLAVLAGILSVGYSIRFIHEVFFSGDGTGMPRTPHEPARWMRAPVDVLALLCLAIGIAPGTLVQPLLTVAAAPVIGGAVPPFSLALWHGVNPPLAMSALSLVGGLVLYRRLRPILDDPRRRATPREPAVMAYLRALRAVSLGARGWTRWLDDGRPQRSLALLAAAALVAGIGRLAATGFTGWPPAAGQAGGGGPALGAADVASVIVWLVLVLATVAATVFHHRRFPTLILLSAVGLTVTLAFVRFAAPDLALTQLLVETVSILLLLLALRFLPQAPPPVSRPARLARDVAIAGVAGLAVGGLVWAVLARPQRTIARFFVDQSVPGGGGTNIVNVILVDFRGFDTMGEITVIAIAGLGVLMLLAGGRPTVADPAPLAGDRHPLILRTVSRAALPLILLVAVFLLLRGHQLPGGGFIAALLTAVGIVIQDLGNGMAWTERRLHLNFRRMTAAGLALAAATGLGSWAFGAPFLTSAHGAVNVPGLGPVELATAMLFDLGVYLTVVGAVVLALSALGRLRVRSAPVRATRAEDDPWQP